MKNSIMKTYRLVQITQTHEDRLLLGGEEQDEIFLGGPALGLGPLPGRAARLEPGLEIVRRSAGVAERRLEIGNRRGHRAGLTERPATRRRDEASGTERERGTRADHSRRSRGAGGRSRGDR